MIWYVKWNAIQCITISYSALSTWSAPPPSWAASPWAARCWSACQGSCWSSSTPPKSPSPLRRRFLCYLSPAAGGLHQDSFAGLWRTFLWRACPRRGSVSGRRETAGWSAWWGRGRAPVAGGLHQDSFAELWRTSWRPQFLSDYLHLLSFKETHPRKPSSVPVLLLETSCTTFSLRTSPSTSRLSFHTRMWLSWPPLTQRSPLGEKATVLTWLWWPADEWWSNKR